MSNYLKSNRFVETEAFSDIGNITRTREQKVKKKKTKKKKKKKKKKQKVKDMLLANSNAASNELR